MPKFKVGDRVGRVGWLVPEYMRKGIITGVVPNKQGQARSTNMNDEEHAEVLSYPLR